MTANYKQIPPMTFKEQQFKGQTIRLDTITYEKCRFDDCDIVYGGNGGFSLVGCKFNDTRFSFDGPASQALSYLSYIYMLSEEVGESYFQSIRDSAKEMKAAAIKAEEAIKASEAKKNG